jgi:hypothetical protein
MVIHELLDHFAGQPRLEFEEVGDDSLDGNRY